jgi:predicted SAM-dependent methyltransferase
MSKELIKRVVRILGFEITRVREPVKASGGLAESSEDYERLARRAREGQVRKLHIGCGPRVLKGWINIDLTYEPFEKYLQFYGEKYYPLEVRGDRSEFYAIDMIRTGLPLPDCSVDIVFHEDFLEHLSQKDQVVFLAESLRVLKPGGVHRVNTPDLLVSMCEHSYFHKGRYGVYTDEWDKYGHLNVLTPTILKEIALMVGYSRVLFNGRDRSTSSLVPLEYRPDPHDRTETGNIFADLIA